eukprot:14966200-Alexandrium_andersonii.AAC.1
MARWLTMSSARSGRRWRACARARRVREEWTILMTKPSGLRMSGRRARWAMARASLTPSSNSASDITRSQASELRPGRPRCA